MGAWSASSFGNDSAGDWVIDLAENPTYAFLRETLQNSIDIPGDADTNSCAVAAAEVISILNGNMPDDYKEVEHNLSAPVATLKQKPLPADLKPLAITCLNAILADSELKELWEEDEEWTNDMQRLIGLLKK